MNTTLQDYWITVAEFQNDYPDSRPGQTCFNMLRNLRPDLSERIKFTGLDPCYRDERVPEFADWLRENW